MITSNEHLLSLVIVVGEVLITTTLAVVAYFLKNLISKLDETIVAVNCLKADTGIIHEKISQIEPAVRQIPNLKTDMELVKLQIRQGARFASHSVGGN